MSISFIRPYTVTGEGETDRIEMKITLKRFSLFPGFILLLYVYIYVSLKFANDGQYTAQQRHTPRSSPRSSGHVHHHKFSNLSGNSRTLAIAKDTARKGKPLLLSVVNYAFLPLTHSWLCNTQFMGIHPQVMIIVPDVKSRKELERKWPDIHVVNVPDLGFTRDSLNFSTAGYIRVMVYRTKLINKLLINNVDLFLFEVDAVWFRNPVDDIKDRIVNNDMAAVLVTTFKDLFAGGLLYLKATNTTKAIWAKLTTKMYQLGETVKRKPDGFKISDVENDQFYLSSILAKHIGSVNLAKLPGDVYADGKWYNDTKHNPHPILINNNWVIGREAKIKRAIEHNHWFWNMKSQTCDTDLVKSMCS